MVEPQQPDNRDEERSDGKQYDHIAQHPLCLGLLPLAKPDGDQAPSSETDQHSEGHRDEHERKSHRDAGDCIGTQGMADEDAVDGVVESLGHRSNDRRNGKTKQQAGNAGSPQLFRTIHVDADPRFEPVAALYLYSTRIHGGITIPTSDRLRKPSRCGTDGRAPRRRGRTAISAGPRPG